MPNNVSKIDRSIFVCAEIMRRLTVLEQAIGQASAAREANVDVEEYFQHPFQEVTELEEFDKQLSQSRSLRQNVVSMKTVIRTLSFSCLKYGSLRLV